MRGNKRSLEHRARPTFPTEQDFGITRNLVPGPRWNIPKPRLSPFVDMSNGHRENPASPAPGPAKQPRSSRPPSTRAAGTGTSSSSGQQQSSDPSTLPVPPRGRRINQRRRSPRVSRPASSPIHVAGRRLGGAPSTVCDGEEVGVAAFVGLSFAPKPLSGPIRSKAGPPRRGLRSSRDGDGVHAMDERAAGGGRFQTFQGSGAWGLGSGPWRLGLVEGKGGISTHCGGGEVFFVLHLHAGDRDGWEADELHTVF